jgi:hypothetical protein
LINLPHEAELAALLKRQFSELSVIPFLLVCLKDAFFIHLVHQHRDVCQTLLSSMWTSHTSTNSYLLKAIGKAKYQNRAATLCKHFLAGPSQHEIPEDDIKAIPPFLIGLAARMPKYQTWIRLCSTSFSLVQLAALAKGITQKQTALVDGTIATLTPFSAKHFLGSLNHFHLNHFIERHLPDFKAEHQKLAQAIKKWGRAYDALNKGAPAPKNQLETLQETLDILKTQVVQSLKKPLFLSLAGYQAEASHRLVPTLLKHVHACFLERQQKKELLSLWQAQLNDMQSFPDAEPDIHEPLFSKEYASLFKFKQLKEMGFKQANSLFRRGIRSDRDFSMLGMPPDRLDKIDQLITKLKEAIPEAHLKRFNRCFSFRSLRCQRDRKNNICSLLTALSQDASFQPEKNIIASLWAKAALYAPIEKTYVFLKHSSQAEQWQKLGEMVEFASSHQLFAVLFRYLKQPQLPQAWQVLNAKGKYALSEIAGIEEKDVFDLAAFTDAITTEGDEI